MGEIVRDGYGEREREWGERKKERDGRDSKRERETEKEREKERERVRFVLTSAWFDIEKKPDERFEC